MDDAWSAIVLLYERSLKFRSVRCRTVDRCFPGAADAADLTGCNIALHLAGTVSERVRVESFARTGHWPLGAGPWRGGRMSFVIHAT